MTTVATVKLADGRHVRLGRIIPKALPQALRLRSYMLTSGTPPPARVDYFTKAMPSIRRMYLNDQWGDCVIASKAHGLGIWSGNDADSGGIVQATDQEILSQYHGICGPGDNGCDITRVLDVMRTRGFLAGGKLYKIDGYVAIDNTNRLEVSIALYLFGALTLGIDLPQAWLDAPDNGIWDVTRSAIVGGHDVVLCGYTEQGVQVGTWGGLRTITWAAFTAKTWITEVYAALAPLWYNSDRIAPCGIDATALLADLAKLSNGVLPDIGPPAPPPPPPPPTPTVCPAGYHWDAVVGRCVPDAPSPPPPATSGPSLTQVLAANDAAFALMAQHNPYYAGVLMQVGQRSDAAIREAFGAALQLFADKFLEPALLHDGDSDMITVDQFKAHLGPTHTANLDALGFNWQAFLANLPQIIALLTSLFGTPPPLAGAKKP